MKSPFNIFKKKFKTKESLIKETEGMTEEQIQKLEAMNFYLNMKDERKKIDYSNKVEVFLSSGSKKAPKQFNEKLGTEIVYKNISPFFSYVNNINDHLRGKQSGTELINNAIEIDKINFSHTKAKINGSISGIQETVKRFQGSTSFNVFDTETRSGRGSNGIQELDGLTELSFRAYDRIDGKVVHNKERSLETIIGISQDEFERYEKIFKDEFNENGFQGVEKNSVIAKAFAKLGHRDTSYSADTNLPGIFTMDAYVGDDAENLMSQENILRGLQRYRDIGIAQESARTKNGLMAWEEMMLEAAHRINTEVSVGYNSENFDIKVMDQAVGRIWRGIKDPNVKASLESKYGINPGESFNVIPKRGTHLDVFNISKTVASIKGKHGILKDNKDSFRMMSDTGLTALTQELLGRTYVPEAFKEGIAAHTAGADVDVLAKLVSSEFLTDSMDLIDKQDIYSGAIEKNDIFIAKNGSYFNPNTGENSISFVKNSATGAIRLFNGYDLKPDGSVEYTEVGKATGLKRNVAYEITSMAELDVNDKMVEQLSKVNQDYARNKIFALEMTPLINENIAGRNEILQDKVVHLFTSKEHMEGFATSNILRIGHHKEDGYVGVTDPREAKAVKEALGTRVIKDGVISEAKESTIDEIINKGSLIAANDSAARSIRNNEYSKAVQFQKVQDILRSNGYETVEAQKRRIGQITSSKISKGKDLKIDHSILSVLEYKDRTSKQNKIHPGSINNLVNSYEYMASRRHVVDKVIDAANKMTNDKGGRQLAYDTLMEGIRYDAANLIDKNDPNLAGNNSTPLEVYNKDLGYYEIQMPDGYFKQLDNKATPDDINDIVRINLNDPNEYGFMNDLFRRTRGDNLAYKNKNTKEAYLTQELDRFIREVNEMDEHKGVFDDIIGKLDDELPSTILAEQIKEKLAAHRANNPTAGYITDSTQEIVLTSDRLLQNLSNDFIEESINRNIGLVPKTMTLDSASDIQLMSTAEHIVDQVFMPKVRNNKGELLTNLDDIVKFAEQTYGFNPTQSRNMLDQFNMMRNDYIQGISSMVKAVSKFDGTTILMDANRRKLSIGVDGKDYIMDQIPKVEFKNGMVHLVTGSNRVAAGLKVYAKDAIEGDNLNTSNVEIASVLKGMLNPLNSLDSRMNRANSRKESLGNAFISTISKVGENARAGASIDTYTSKNINSFFTLDFTEALEAMAYQTSEISSYPNWKDKEFSQIIKKNADQLKRGVVPPSVKEASIKNLQDILMMVKGIQPGEKLDESKLYERIIGNLNSYTKATTLTDGKIHLTNYDATPLGEFDGKSRPPISSTDEVIIRKSDVEKLATKKGLEGKILPGARITNKRLGASKHIDGVGEVVTGVTYKTANISEDAFKTIVQAELDTKISTAKSAKEKEMLINAKKIVSGYNLTEQGKLMDFDVVKAFTSGIENQSVSLKNFEKDSRVNTKMMQKRLEDAMPTLKIAKSGEIVFSLGKQTMVEKGTPIVAMRGYGGAIETIGAKEDLGFFGIKVFGYNSKLEVGESAISELLNANKKNLIGPDGKLNEKAAHRLISENFDVKLHIENAFSPTYVKNTIEAAEKGMYEAMVAPAGALDNRVSAILDAVNLPMAKGRVLQDRTIDEVVNRYNNLSEKNKRLLGIQDGESVREIIEGERGLMSSIVREIGAFKGSVAFANDNISKHKNAGMATKTFINNTVDYYISQGMSYEEASVRVINEIKDRKIIEGLDIGFDGKQIQIGEVDYRTATINNKALENFTNEIGLYGENSPIAIKNSNGNIVGYTSVNESSFNIDFSGTAGSSRQLESLKESLLQANTDLRELVGGSPEYDAKKLEIKDLTHRLNATKRTHKTMKVSSRETNMLGLLSYDNNKMQNIRSAVGEENYRKMYGVMLDSDGNLLSDYQGKKIHNSFLKDIQNRFNSQAAETSSYHNKGIEAIEYNKNPLQFEDAMAGRGFEDVNINDIVLPKGEGSDFLETHPNSAINRNMMVSTGVYDASGREVRVAVPKANYSITGDTVNTDDVQSALSSLQMASIRLEEGRKGNLLQGETVDGLTDAVKERAAGVREAVIERQKKLYKGLDSIKIDGYAYEKASMSHYEKGNLYEALNVSEFEGKSLANWADEGVHLDYSHHGRGYFERLGYFDEKVWGKKYGMESVEQMEDHLSKFGTTGLESRTPTIQSKSVSVARQYFDRGLNYNETKTSSPLALGRNQDQDGDKILQAELKYNGYTQVDYDIMKNKGEVIPDDVAEYFEESKRAQFYKASTINKRIYENKAKPLYEGDKSIPLKNSNVNEVVKASSMDGETVLPHMQVEAESSVVNDNLARYKKLEAEARMNYGEDGFNALDDSQRRSAIKDFVRNSGFSEAEMEDYDSLIRFKDVYTRDSAAKMSKVAGKASIGTINLPLFSLRIAGGSRMSGDENQLFQAAAYVIEEKMISKKHDNEVDISMAESVKDSINSLIRGDSSKIAVVKGVINDKLQDEIYTRIQNETDLDLSKYDKETAMSAINSLWDKMGAMAREDTNFKAEVAALNASRNLNEGNYEEILRGIRGSTSSASLTAMAENGYDMGRSKVKYSAFDNSGFESSAKKVAFEAADDVVKKISSSGIGLGALGLAAAVMATGYIGGNPTIAPGNETSAYDDYESLQDEDLSIQRLPQGTGQGYVVNINAQGAKGKDHAMKAIQQAMQTSMPMDINIAMSMEDKRSIIDSRFIDKLLSDAL